MNSNVLKTKYIYVCIQQVNLINHHQVEFIWDIMCNIDECAINGSSLDEIMSCNEFRTPLVVVANKTDDWVITTRWSAIDFCIISRIFWLYCLWERTLNIMSADTVSIRLSLGTVCTMNLHQYYSIYRSFVYSSRCVFISAFFLEYVKRTKDSLLKYMCTDRWL